MSQDSVQSSDAESAWMDVGASDPVRLPTADFGQAKHTDNVRADPDYTSNDAGPLRDDSPRMTDTVAETAAKPPDASQKDAEKGQQPPQGDSTAFYQSVSNAIPVLNGVMDVIGALIEADKEVIRVGHVRDVLARTEFVHDFGRPVPLPSIIPSSAVERIQELEREAARITELAKNAEDVRHGLLATYLVPLANKLGVALDYGQKYSPERIRSVIEEAAGKLNVLFHSKGLGVVMNGLDVVSLIIDFEKAYHDPSVENQADVLFDLVGVAPIIAPEVAPIAAPLAGGYSLGQGLIWAIKQVTGTDITDIGSWQAEHEIQDREALRAAIDEQVLIFGWHGPGSFLNRMQAEAIRHETQAGIISTPTPAPAAGTDPADSDGDGVPDSTPAPAAGTDPADSDGDGVPDSTPAPAAGTDPADSDGDGVPDSTPAPAAGTDPADSDGDGVPDSTPAPAAGTDPADSDGDGVPDSTPAPAAGTDPADSDGDGVPDSTPAPAAGTDPHFGATASTFDPAHSIAVPNALTAPPAFTMEADAAARAFNLEAAANPGPVVLAADTAQSSGQQPLGKDHDPGVQGTPEPQQPSFQRGELTPQISHPGDGDAVHDHDDATITSNQQVTDSQTLGHDQGPGSFAGIFDPAHVETSGRDPDLDAPPGTTIGDYSLASASAGAFDPAHNMAAPDLATPAPGPDIGASAGAFDPAHNMAAPDLATPAPGPDIGASAGAFDPAHNMAAPNLLTATGPGPHSSTFDPSNDQSQNAALQLSEQMYQQAQHIDQLTQHVHEPTHQQVYDPGGHGE